jgi:ammonia channel protein AmtB
MSGMCVGSLLWYAVGFSLVFGESLGGGIGNPATFPFFHVRAVRRAVRMAFRRLFLLTPHPSNGSSSACRPTE